MLPAHMVAEVIADNVLMPTEAAAERRCLPLVAQVVVRRLSYINIAAAPRSSFGSRYSHCQSYTHSRLVFSRRLVPVVES